jgi:hypothetical protein
MRTEWGKQACGGQVLFDSLKLVHGQGSQDVWFALGYNTGDYIVTVADVAMNLGNVNWRNFWYQRTWKDLFSSNPIFTGSADADGLLADVASVGTAYNHYLFCPLSNWTGSSCSGPSDYPSPYWTPQGGWDDAKWRTDMEQFIVESSQYFRSKNKLIAYNLWQIRRVEDSLFTMISSDSVIAMDERGFTGLNGGGWPPDTNQWKLLFEYFKKANYPILCNNVVVIPSGRGKARLDSMIVPGVRGWDALWFAMTSFMLGYDPVKKNGYFSFVVFTQPWGSYRDVFWVDEYDPNYLNLGMPLDTAIRLPNGVYQREFELGWVWVNITGNAQVVTVPNGDSARILNHDNFKNPNSVPAVQQFTLNPYSGVVGLSVRKTGIDRVDASGGVKVYPNPNSGIFHVEFPSRGRRRIRVLDMKGGSVIETYTSEKSVEIDVSRFADGVYIVEVIGGEGVFHQVMVKE